MFLFIRVSKELFGLSIKLYAAPQVFCLLVILRDQPASAAAWTGRLHSVLRADGLLSPTGRPLQVFIKRRAFTHDTIACF